MGGGVAMPSSGTIDGGFLTGKKLIYPLTLVISLFFLWGFSYGLLDVLNKHFQDVLKVTRLESTGLQVMYFGGGYFLFSPVAAEVLRRKGYRVTILMGLGLYSLGAVMFWPTAHFSNPGNEKASFGGFLACTFVIACGLSTLETAANSYAVVIGDPATASARLQFCQAWNGVASFVGPLIASKYFFSGANANSLVNVQYVYLAVACAGLAVAVLFFFSKLPEVSEQEIRRASIVEDGLVEVARDRYGNIIGDKPLWKEYNMIFGFIAQFCYVGAQVTCATFFINYGVENAGLSKATSANLLSAALGTFTAARFIAAGVSVIFESNFIIIVYACCAIALTSAVAAVKGSQSIGILIAVFFFMAPMYPCIFTLGTQNLGRNTRRGAGILVMGVSGGAVFPPIQAAIADNASTRISYVVPVFGFAVVLAYVSVHWVRHGMHVFRVKGPELLAVSQEGGALGGVITSVNYNEKDLNPESIEHVRRASVASVNGITGGQDKRPAERRRSSIVQSQINIFHHEKGFAQ